MRISFRLVLALLCGLGLVARAAGDLCPFDFNVYALHDIGTPTQGYGSDFQGRAGAGGSAYFTGFSLHDDPAAGPSSPYSLYVGGDVYLSGQINNGGIEAGANVYINHAGVNGTIRAGGNLGGLGGSVAGDAYLGGQFTGGPSVTVAGTVASLTAFAPSFDLAGTSQYFLSLSQSAGALASNRSVVTQYGQLQIDLLPGLNTVSLTSAQLDQAWGVRISGPADATLVVNVPDTAVRFDSLQWDYVGGMSASRALLNMPNALTLQLSGGNHSVNFLAPYADTTFSSGLVTDNLIAGSLQGGGQVNWGQFTGQVPEPATLGVLGLAMLLVRRR